MTDKGVRFGDIHSFRDLDLILSPFAIPPAEPKINLLDIPAGDGSLDLTEALGEVKYNDREFVMKFTVNPLSEMTFDEKVTQVANALNGKEFEIYFDRDPKWFWEGRCIVSEHAQNKVIQEITIKAIVRPYKTKETWTQHSCMIQEGEAYCITAVENNRKTVVPQISGGQAYIKFAFEDKEYTFENLVTNIYPEIQLKEGTNEFIFYRTRENGQQLINITFREGAL